MTTGYLLLGAGLIIFCHMMIWFFVATWRENNGLADVAWGLNATVAALSLFLILRNLELPVLLVLSMVVVWSARLVVHIGVRSFKSSEDPRYASWRQEWERVGGPFWVITRSAVQIFLLQGVLSWISIMPLAWVLVAESVVWQIFAIGALLWCVGIVFEGVGDAQLTRFLSDSKNKGRLMTSGLWSYTRHPNYFGEATLWWGIWIMALALGAPAWTVLSPILITVLVRFVSGVPMTEERLKKKEGWAVYALKTSPFFPRPPRGRNT